MVAAIADRLRQDQPERQVDVRVRPGVHVMADAALLRIALENLLANAWKFTSKLTAGCIEFGLLQAEGQSTYFVRDHGAGFDMADAHRLFGPFQRLHLTSEFPGTGIGLATVRWIIHRHGGTIWADSTPGQGACFYFTLGQSASAEPPALETAPAFAATVYTESPGSCSAQ